MKVYEIMTLHAESITPDSTTRQAAQIMHDLHLGSLPVMSNNKLVGIITDRDICCKVIASGRGADSTKVDKIMTKEVTTCFEDQELDDVAIIMMDHRIRRLAVLDRNNTMTGFLSVDDIARTSYDLASAVLAASAVLH